MENLTNSFKHININKEKIPTYLKIFLNNNSDITLIRSKHSKMNTSPNNDTIINETNNYNNEQLDLTGNPLEIDLGGNDTLFNATCILENPYSWSNDEATHFPIPLKEARKVINDYLRKKIFPIYAFCDGTDPEKTVILGTDITRNQFIRVLIYILGYYSVKPELNELETMKLEHLKSVQTSSASVQYLITKYYNIFAYHIKNNSILENIENNCSARLEVISRDMNQNKLNLRILLQVIAGHKKSPLIPFWNDLCLIQSFIKISSDSNLKQDFNTIISNEGADENFINNQIANLLKTMNYMKREKSRRFDLENLRYETFFDNLWKIMKRNSNLSDLRDAFLMLFEQISEGGSNLQTTGNETFIISVIINGILKREMMIPTLSMSQSLELLIELGLEKLHNDYMAIINNFYAAFKEKLKEIWSELNTKVLLPMKNRVSINPKSCIINHEIVEKKLSHLYKLHVIAEFMFNKYFVLSEETLDDFYESLIKNFLKQNELIDVDQLQLHEFSFFLGSAEHESIPSTPPEYWSIEMNSVLKNSTVTTIFQCSQYPIFPNINCGDNDVTRNCDETIQEPCFYVTKCVRYVDNI